MKNRCETSKDCPNGKECFEKKCTSLNINLLNDRMCFVSDDCPDTYYCNNEKRCALVENTIIVMKKQTCPRVFKKTCTNDRHCPCKEKKMICEVNECVYAKNNRVSPKNGPCNTHPDCQENLLCYKGKCIVVKNIRDLITLPFSRSQKCQVDSDCKPYQRCNNTGFCQSRRLNMPSTGCKNNENCSQNRL